MCSFKFSINFCFLCLLLFFLSLLFYYFHFCRLFYLHFFYVFLLLSCFFFLNFFSSQNVGDTYYQDHPKLESPKKLAKKFNMLVFPYLFAISAVLKYSEDTFDFYLINFNEISKNPLYFMSNFMTFISI